MRSCLAQHPLQVRQWVVSLRAISLTVTQSRAIMFLYELGCFFLIVTLLFVLHSKKSFEGFIIVSFLFLVPMCAVRALDIYILLGRMLDISDADLEFAKGVLLGRDAEGVEKGQEGDGAGAGAQVVEDKETATSPV